MSKEYVDAHLNQYMRYDEEREFYRNVNNEDYIKQAYEMQNNKRTELANQILQQEADLKANEKIRLQEQDAAVIEQRRSSRQVEYDELFNSKEWDKYYTKHNKRPRTSSTMIPPTNESIEEVIDAMNNNGVRLGRGQNSYRFSDERKIHPDANFPRYKVDTEGNITQKVTKTVVNEGTDNLAKSHLKKALSGRNLNALLNIGMTMNDYHEARNAGDGVLKAGVKAGAQFVAGEALGMWMMPVMMAKSVPTLAISAVETAQTVTRKMNSVSRTQVFGEAQFQDTQQLATMRQAGMELARMSQYNLQQAIMGNEAQYMHRL